ncbi:2675_t:CDS:2 [Racocetra persica]|uniref:2675_t:CDS:1 n=1 Tax=Racocetra persica TaxID=160502 RepID=A0ACA9LI80_9GLOM|nr:2675_t:CDS:2 [Racocetra persica]
MAEAEMEKLETEVLIGKHEPYYLSIQYCDCQKNHENKDLSFLIRAGSLC